VQNGEDRVDGGCVGVFSAEAGVSGGSGVVPWVCGRCREGVGAVNADRAAADAAIGYEELCGACMSAVALEEGDDLIGGGQ